MTDPLHTPLIPHARVVPPVAPSPARATARPMEASTEASAEPPGGVPVADEAPVAAVRTVAAPATPATVQNTAIGPVAGREPLQQTPELQPNQEPHPVREPHSDQEPHPDQEPEPAQKPSAARRWGIALALILASAVIGVLLADPPARSGLISARGGDLLLLVAERGLDVEPEQAVTDREAARAFVQDQTGLRIQPPRLDGAALTGASVVRFAEAFPVPMFVVEVADERVPIYAVTYAHLDAAEGAVTLARPIANRIVARNVHVQPLGPAGDGTLTSLVWRDRATIYVALTDAPDAVVDAIEL
ncbi:MAG: hypothetical protein AAFP18_10575 [Bacteroidota bacterium]